MKRIESTTNTRFANATLADNPLTGYSNKCTINTCTTVTTSNPAGTDEFSDAKTTSSSMATGGYADLPGDFCNGLVGSLPRGNVFAIR
jgi:hypothetical protein